MKVVSALIIMTSVLSKIDMQVKNVNMFLMEQVDFCCDKCSI